ncbi:MAG: CrcB family protein [Rhizobiaceae bacterium]|nr:CrcB family protein [Rhizobiaceae bacterium]
MSEFEEALADEEEPRPTPAGGRLHASGWSRLRERTVLYAVVSAGSVVGSVLRALASLAALDWFGPGFPWGTLFVNVLGSFVIGFYATLTGPDGRMAAGMFQRQFVMTGICGGFTTFSLFSLEALQSLRAGDLAAAGAYVGISAVAWLVSVWLGHALASRLNRQAI